MVRGGRGGTDGGWGEGLLPLPLPLLPTPPLLVSGLAAPVGSTSAAH